MLGRALLAWLLLVVLAVLNGGFRQAVLLDRLGERGAHVVSSVLLSGLILAATYLTISWIRPSTGRDAWLVGGGWLLLTLAFEFLVGHYVFGGSWQKLFSDYNLARGRIWVLVLGTTLVAPALSCRLRQP